MNRPSRRFVRDQAGQVLAIGLFALMLLVLVAAAVVDAAVVLTTRDWAFSVASAAALRGVAAGRDLSSVPTLGRPTLDATRADAEARAVVAEALARRGLSAALLDVRVRATGAEPTEPGFPSTDPPGGGWTSEGPAVGVELHVDVAVRFFGLVAGTATAAGGGSALRVRAFAAAGLCGGDVTCRPGAGVPTPPSDWWAAPAPADLLLRARSVALPVRASAAGWPAQSLGVSASEVGAPLAGVLVVVTVTSPVGREWSHARVTDAEGALLVNAATTGEADFGSWDGALETSLGVWSARAELALGNEVVRSSEVYWLVRWDRARLLE